MLREMKRDATLNVERHKRSYIPLREEESLRLVKEEKGSIAYLLPVFVRLGNLLSRLSHMFLVSVTS